MRVDFTQTVNLAATQEDAWKLLRDTKRLSGLIPGVEEIASTGLDGTLPHETHVVRVVEKIGPFRISLSLEVKIVQAVELSLLQAELSGADGNGQNRLAGTLRAELKESEPGETQLRMDASVEVIGKMAALGALPIRRRANELFAEFAGRMQGQFSAIPENPIP